MLRRSFIMNEIIKNAIDVYIQEEKSDYAVMLNGPWGCGKTYFVKNELIDYLQDEFNRDVVYISLFGINNLDELYNSIALQVLNIKATETLDKKIKMNNPSYDNSNKKTIFERSKISLWTGILNKGLKIIPDNNVINSVASEINKDSVLIANKYDLKIKNEDAFITLKNIDYYIDALILDPPREGIDKKVIDEIIRIKPKKIIYVSCDPMTFARDLNLLKDHYNLSDLNIIDMFADTYHIELISFLEYKN